MHLSCLTKEPHNLFKKSMAQTFALPNHSLAHCFPHAGGHCPCQGTRAWQQSLCCAGATAAPPQLSLAPGDGHRHTNLNSSTTNPLLVSQQPSFPAVSRSMQQTSFSHWSRGHLQKGERPKINKRMPVPLKEFSFIGSSPLPPFQ